MDLKQLCRSNYHEEVKTFILAYSIQTQIERLGYYGMNNERYVGVVIAPYESALKILEQGNNEIRTLVELCGTFRISYVIELKTVGKKGRGMFSIVNYKQLKYLEKNYVIKNKITINQGHINQLLLQNFEKMNQLL